MAADDELYSLKYQQELAKMRRMATRAEMMREMRDAEERLAAEDKRAARHAGGNRKKSNSKLGITQFRVPTWLKTGENGDKSGEK